MSDLCLPAVEDSLQDFFAGLPIGLYRTSAQGKLLHANASLVDMLGYPDMATLLTCHVTDLCPIVEEREQWYRQMLTEGRVKNFALRMRRYDGRLIWVKDNARAVYHSDDPTENQVAYFEGVMEEITDQVAAREALERAEVMREVAQIVNASLDRNEVLRRSLSQLRRVIAYNTGSVYIYAEGVRPEIVISAGYDDEHLTAHQGAKLLENSPILRQMSQDHKPVLSGDARHLPGWIWVPGAEHVRSFIAVPLMARQQMIGALMIDSVQPHFFDETHLQIVHALAQSVAIAVENARLFGVMQRSLADQSALLAATTAVSISLDLTTALTHLAEQMGAALQVPQTRFFSYDHSQQAVNWIASYEVVPTPSTQTITPPENLLSRERLPWLAQNKPVQAQIDDPYLPSFLHKRLRQTGMTAALYVPVVTHETIVGFAELLDDFPQRVFTQSEIALAKGMAQQAAISFENARLYQAEAQRRREAETLYQLAGHLTSTLDLDDVFQRAIEAVRQNVVDLQGCAISLLEEDGCLRVRANWAREDKYIYIPTGTRVSVQDTYVSAAVLEAREPVVIENLQQAALKSHQLYSALERGIRALLYVPLLAHGEPIGILHLNVFHAPRRFLPEEIALCQGVANQMAVAVENARLFAAERRQLQLSQTLQKVGALLTAQISLSDLFDQIFDLLAQVVNYDSVSIQLIDGDSTYMAAGKGFPDFDLAAEIVSKITAPTLQERWGETQTGYVVIPDTHAHERWDVSLGNEYIRSWMGAALVVKDRMLGTLNVDSKTPYAYNAEVGATVAAFANQAAVAIENARLYEETRQRVNELAVLHQVALATTAVANADDLLRQTTEMVAESLYPDTFGFLLVDPETGWLTSHASYHGLAGDSLPASVPLNRGMVGYVADTGRPLLARDVSQEPRYHQVTASTRSEVAVPLLLRHQVVGVINVESPRLNAFGETDLHFLTTLAGQVSIALERAELYESLQKHTVHLAQEVGQRTAELRAERDRTQAILDSAGEGIFFADRQGIVLYANPAMARLTGYSAPDMLGQTLRLWQPHGAIMDNAYAPLWKALTDGQSWGGELISRRKDGALYDVSLTIAPIFGGGGGLTGFVGIHSDISRLKEVERLKSQFVSNVSHELRTPLTNIKTFVTLLQRGRAERRDYYLDVLGHETERLTRLIQDLLDLSRLESELERLQLLPVDLARLIPDLCDSLSVKAEMRHTSLRLDLPDDLPNVLAESSQLESVILNLVGNALNYTPEGSEITVSAGVGERDGRQMVWFKVTDNGHGIPPEDLDRLFDRFYRGKMSQERNIPGTGLGLAICKEIIARHQGAIEVDSQPGEGVTFTVWLQLAPAD